MPIPTLETDRLRLRPFTAADAAEVQRLAGDRAIADTTLNIPHPYEDGAAEAWIGTHEEQFASGRGANFAIALRSDGRLLGSISLMGIDALHGHAELGYWIGKDHWGQGYCTEAGRAVLRYAFGTLGLHRVHAHHLVRNPASGRVLRKLGMRSEGCMRQHVKRWDVHEDIELYGILASDAPPAEE